MATVIINHYKVRDRIWIQSESYQIRSWSEKCRIRIWSEKYRICIWSVPDPHHCIFVYGNILNRCLASAPPPPQGVAGLWSSEIRSSRSRLQITSRVFVLYFKETEFISVRSGNKKKQFKRLFIFA